MRMPTKLSELKSSLKTVKAVRRFFAKLKKSTKSDLDAKAVEVSEKVNKRTASKVKSLSRAFKAKDPVKKVEKVEKYKKAILALIDSVITKFADKIKKIQQKEKEQKAAKKAKQAAKKAKKEAKKAAKKSKKSKKTSKKSASKKTTKRSKKSKTSEPVVVPPYRLFGGEFEDPSSSLDEYM